MHFNLTCGPRFRRKTIAACTVFTIICATVGSVSAQSVRDFTVAKDLVSNLTSASQAFGDLAGGDKITSINKMVDAFDKIGKLAPFLGFAASALQVIALLDSNYKSPTEKILNAIDGVDARLTTLNTNLSREMKALGITVKYSSKTSDILKAFSETEAHFDWWRDAVNEANSARTRTTARNKISEEIGVNDKNAKLISDMCVGAFGGDPLFDVVADHTNGDINRISEIGYYSLTAILQAAMVETYFRDNIAGTGPVADLAKMKSGGAPLTPGDVDFKKYPLPKAFMRYYNNCFSAFERMKTHVLSNKGVSDYSLKFLNSLFSTNPPVASIYNNQLKAKFPQREWITVIYDPVFSFKNHYVDGYAYLIKGKKIKTQHTKFRQEFIGGSKRNFVAHFFPLDATKEKDIHYFLKLQNQTVGLSILGCRGSKGCGFPKKAADEIGLIFGQSAIERKVSPWLIVTRSPVDIRMLVWGKKSADFAVYGRFDETGPPDWASSSKTRSFAMSGPTIWTVQSD